MGVKKGQKFANRKPREKTASPHVRAGEQPEDALWRTVILQAMADATVQLPDYRPAYQRKMQALRDQAREWFEQQRKDFRRVCELAGMEHTRVHAFAMQQIKQSVIKEQERINEAIAKQCQPTAKLLTSPTPGVPANFSTPGADRSARSPRDGAKIEFSSNRNVYTQKQVLSAETSGEIATITTTITGIEP